MHCHCGTNNRAPRWTFIDPCKPEVRPDAREESASPAWQAAPAMNARDTTKGIYNGFTPDVDRHYIGSVTATTQQEKGTITLESNPSRGTVLPVPSKSQKWVTEPGVWKGNCSLLACKTRRQCSIETSQFCESQVRYGH